MSATARTVHITGVQLEVGEQATPFEHRSFGDELARCQRYYQKFQALVGNSTHAWQSGAGSSWSVLTPPVATRANPTMTTTPTSGSGATWLTLGNTPAMTYYQEAANSVNSGSTVTADAEL